MADGNISHIKLPNNQTYDINAVTVNNHTVNIDVPATANFTDEKQNITLAATSKAYITAVTDVPTSTATAREAVADTGIYLTATAGELSSLRYSLNNGAATPAEKAYIKYNTDDDCIDFIFV